MRHPLVWTMEWQQDIPLYWIKSLDWNSQITNYERHLKNYLYSVTFQDVANHGSPQLTASGSKQFFTLTIFPFYCLTSSSTNSFDRFLNISLYASCFNYIFPVSCLGVLSNTSSIFTLLCICGICFSNYLKKLQGGYLLYFATVALYMTQDC